MGFERFLPVNALMKGYQYSNTGIDLKHMNFNNRFSCDAAVFCTQLRLRLICNC